MYSIACPNNFYLGRQKYRRKIKWPNIVKKNFSRQKNKFSEKETVIFSRFLPILGDVTEIFVCKNTA